MSEYNCYIVKDINCRAKVFVDLFSLFGMVYRMVTLSSLLNNVLSQLCLGFGLLEIANLNFYLSWVGQSILLTVTIKLLLSLLFVTCLCIKGRIDRHQSVFDLVLDGIDRLYPLVMYCTILFEAFFIVCETISSSSQVSAFYL